MNKEILEKIELWKKHVNEQELNEINSMSEKELDSSMNNYIEHIEDIIDLNNKIDSLNSALFIANYKLGRIKEYNDIAAKGNNIKWSNSA